MIELAVLERVFTSILEYRDPCDIQHCLDFNATDFMNYIDSGEMVGKVSPMPDYEYEDFEQ